MWCRGCNYRLSGIDSRACPECGRAFDPEKPWTYYSKPVQGLPERLVFAMAVAVVGCMGLVVLGLSLAAPALLVGMVLGDAGAGGLVPLVLLLGMTGVTFGFAKLTMRLGRW